MFELLPLLSSPLRVATLLESLHAKHVGIFSSPGRPCLLTCHWLDCAPHSSGGLLAQWSGSRLYLFIMSGLFLIGVSFLYVTIVLSPQSNYVDGLLPPFLARAFGIPLFTSCATLAI